MRTELVDSSLKNTAESPVVIASYHSFKNGGERCHGSGRETEKGGIMSQKSQSRMI